MSKMISFRVEDEIAELLDKKRKAAGISRTDYLIGLISQDDEAKSRKLGEEIDTLLRSAHPSVAPNKVDEPSTYLDAVAPSLEGGRGKASVEMAPITRPLDRPPGTCKVCGGFCKPNAHKNAK